MYVVISTDPTSPTNNLLTFLTSNHMPFSVTDDLSDLQNRNDSKNQSGSLITESTRDTDTASYCSSTESLDFEEPPQKKMRVETEDNLSDDVTKYLQNVILGNSGCSKKKETSISEDVKNSKSPESSGDEKLQTETKHRRVVCNLCNKGITGIPFHQKRHAIAHLGLKTWQCSLCSELFPRSDIATSHFKREHHESEFIPFINTMRPSDKEELKQMLNRCFPKAEDSYHKP